VPRASSRPRSAALRVTTTGLLAALLAASAIISIPIGSVPFTLQVFVVVLIALLVPAGWAAIAVGTYIAAGALGLPVFAGMHGGLGVLLGPTGGYLIGFLIGATAASGTRTLLGRWLRSSLVCDAIAGLVVIAIVYVCGWAQLAVVAHMGAMAALLAGVVPFIALDVLKAAVAVGVAPAVRRVAKT
jgi:biotin transport system substrate-specific component